MVVVILLANVAEFLGGMRCAARTIYSISMSLSIISMRDALIIARPIGGYVSAFAFAFVRVSASSDEAFLWSAACW